jgi:hypothetical protein
MPEIAVPGAGLQMERASKSKAAITRRASRPLWLDDEIVCATGNCGLTCVASWGRSRSQGLGCSPIKAVRELGLERRETVDEPRCL